MPVWPFVPSLKVVAEFNKIKQLTGLDRDCQDKSKAEGRKDE
jgi:hypothetical protein